MELLEGGGRPGLMKAVTLLSMTRQLTITETSTIKKILRDLEEGKFQEVKDDYARISNVVSLLSVFKLFLKAPNVQDIQSELMRQVVSSRNETLVKNMMEVSLCKYCACSACRF